MNMPLGAVSFSRKRRRCASAASASKIPCKRAATGSHEFDTLCAALEIEHRLTPPKSPQTNGMVERFNGRIEEVLQSHHFRSGEELETTLHRYVWLYNQQLPQSLIRTQSSRLPRQRNVGARQQHL
jgi:transposase InsO family protein